MRFFTRQINPRSFGSWCVKGTEESTSRLDSSVPLMHNDPKDLGLICLVKKRKIHFRILSDFRIQSWIFLKKRTLSFDYPDYLSRSRRVRIIEVRLYSNTSVCVWFSLFSFRPGVDDNKLEPTCDKSPFSTKVRDCRISKYQINREILILPWNFAVKNKS